MGARSITPRGWAWRVLLRSRSGGSGGVVGEVAFLAYAVEFDCVVDVFELVGSCELFNPVFEAGDVYFVGDTAGAADEVMMVAASAGSVGCF